MSLREKQAAERRRKMLDAAESLIRKAGGTDFSMRALAKTAAVGPTTPYNFFGSKEGLLFELLARSLKSFMNEALVHSSDDPIEQVLEAAENAVDILLKDPIFLRPLYQVMLGLTDPIHHPKFIKAAFVFYRTILNGAVEHKLLADDQDRISLACALMAHFMGVLDLWVHEDINDDRFRAQIVYGFVHLLWPLARGKSLKMLQRRHSDVKKVLSNQQLQPPFIVT